MRIVVYCGVILASMGLLSFPFMKRAPTLNAREKSAFVLAGTLGIVWVLLGLATTSQAVAPRNVMAALLIIKTLVCGMVSGIVLALLLCGYFKKNRRSG